MTKQAIPLVTCVLLFFSAFAFAGQLLEMNADLLPANPSSQKQKSHIIVHSGAQIHISKGSSLITTANVVLEGNIIGEGKLVIKSDKKISIDAHNHTIENLVIENLDGVELKSHLQIGNELAVTEGKLFLNDFNITLSVPFGLINVSHKAEIVYNGIGIILVPKEVPLAQNQDKCPRLFPNHFKFLTSDWNRNIRETETYTYYLPSDSLLTGAIQTVDPPPRLS